jgi:hypothetical protein
MVPVQVLVTEFANAGLSDKLTLAVRDKKYAQRGSADAHYYPLRRFAIPIICEPQQAFVRHHETKLYGIM